MKFICGTDFNLKHTCVAFGEFEALHAGHKAIIDTLDNIKKTSKDLTTVLVIFEDKDKFFEKDKVIYTEKEKIKILENENIDMVILYPFTAQTAAMEPKEFIKNVLVEKLGAKKIVVGSNYKFGKDRVGDVSIIKGLADKYGYSVIECPMVTYNNKIITSKKIREDLLSGQIEEANEMLGRIFKMSGEVVHGKALGRTVGMPTANLKVDDTKLLPEDGVYATLSEIDGKVVKGLTNIGRRPSVDNNSYITIETFLLDFSKDIYGLDIDLNIHEYIRGVQKFNNLDEVKKQVEKDIASIRKYLDSVS